jgi:hypothetical protein
MNRPVVRHVSGHVLRRRSRSKNMFGPRQMSATSVTSNGARRRFNVTVLLLQGFGRLTARVNAGRSVNDASCGGATGAAGPRRGVEQVGERARRLPRLDGRGKRRPYDRTRLLLEGQSGDASGRVRASCRRGGVPADAGMPDARGRDGPCLNIRAPQHALPRTPGLPGAVADAGSCDKVSH